MSSEQLLAALGLLACAGIGVRGVLPERWRRRLDDRLHRTWRGCRRAGLNLWHWRDRRRRAASAADAAIRRARGGFERDGNVVRPKSFKRPRKPH